MSEFQIKRAERSQANLRVAFTGASFAGKTTASLLLAKGIVEALISAGKLQPSQDPKIGVIDTERRSAQLYAHLVPFDTIELGPPYSIARYTGALHAMEAAGYPVIIIDSLSHAWAGQGGLLQSMKGEGFGEWKKKTPEQDEFIDTILRSPAHTIVTMRSKQEYVIEDKLNGQGKMVKTPRRIGLAPIQRSGVEFEFTTVLDLQMNGDSRTINITKDRTGVFGEIQLASPKDWHNAGAKAIDWLLGGAVQVREESEPTPQEKAEAMCQAAERLMPRQTNLPDLARTFQNAYEQIKGLAQLIGIDGVRPLLRRVIEAKDARKSEIGDPVSKPPQDMKLVTPDDVDAIEAMLMLGKIGMDEFKQEFGVNSIPMLPYDAFDEVVTWAINTAVVNGQELSRPSRTAVTQPVSQTSLNKAKQILEKHGKEKSANDLLAEAEDNLN